MVNGISVKQAIENELADKTEYTISDTIKCIKHLASGFDNMKCVSMDARVSKLEEAARWSKKIFVVVWGITGGALVVGARALVEHLKH